MQKRVWALLLALSLLPLSGCAAMLERGRETVSTHVDYAVTEDESILRAETYQGLVNAMLYFVSGHRTGGTIRLYNYTGDVEADLANARDEVMYDDPLGAYSVGDLTCGVTRILTYYEIELQITYIRTAREMDALREVTGLAGVRQELTRLVTEGGRSATFLASYFTGDGALVEQLFRLACRTAPELFRHHQLDASGAGVSVAFYPETGARRIVEVKLNLPLGADEEEGIYADQLEAVSSALLGGHRPAGEGYTVEELAALVRGAAGAWEEEGSHRALDALSGAGASDFGLLMAMEYLCRQCGIAAEPVEGAQGLWLIVNTPQGSRHLLPQSLRPVPLRSDGEEPGEPEFRLYTDRELTELGYEWATSLYPVCLDNRSAEG